MLISKTFCFRRGLEKRVCHWGFDPENWRSYLILPIEITQGKRRADLEKNLDSLRERFNPTRVNYLNNSPTQPGKRRFVSICALALPFLILWDGFAG